MPALAVPAVRETGNLVGPPRRCVGTVPSPEPLAGTTSSCAGGWGALPQPAPGDQQLMGPGCKILDDIFSLLTFDPGKRALGAVI